MMQFGHHLRLAVLAVGILATACGTSSSVSESQAREAAGLAKQIRADPTHGPQILADAGTTPEAFDALMYAIAEDPAASAAYARELAK